MQKCLVCPQIRSRELFTKMLRRFLSPLKETSGCCVIFSACFVIVLRLTQMVTHFINCPLVGVFFSRQVTSMCYAVTKKSLVEMPVYVKIPVIICYAFVVHFGLSYFMVAFSLLTFQRFHKVCE